MDKLLIWLLPGIYNFRNKQWKQDREKVPEERFDFSCWLRFSSIKLTLKKTETHTHTHTLVFLVHPAPAFFPQVQINEGGWESWGERSLLSKRGREALQPRGPARY